MEQKKRIEYIDALRGFTMILVVYSHVHNFSLKCEDLFSYNELFVLLRMPLFFFISGFLIEKSNRQWTMVEIVPFIKKKMKIQLIPTFVFMATFCCLYDFNLWDCLFDEYKQGYWFTITLFECFLLHSICKMCPIKIQHKLYFFISVCLCILQIFKLNFNNIALSIPQIGLLWYFVFFSFGVYIKDKFESFIGFLNSKWYPIIFVSFVMIALWRIKGDFLINLPFQRLQQVILGVMGICIVFKFFFKYQRNFQGGTISGNILQYIGKRTLDVYLLHYLILPWNLSPLGDFFRNNPNPTIEFAVSITLSILVIALCLLISNIIRTSDFLGRCLFGAKR